MPGDSNTNNNGPKILNKGDNNVIAAPTGNNNKISVGSNPSKEEKKSFWQKPLVIAITAAFFSVVIFGLIAAYLKAKYIDTPETIPTTPTIQSSK